MSTGKTVLALALSALLPASAAWAANKDTIIYCSEASPESFNPQIASSGPSFVASSQTLYNRLINFDPVKNTPVPSLAESWTISPDGKTYTFTLRKGVKFNSNKYFKPTRDFNADDVIFSVMRQKDPKHPYHNVSQGNYEYFNDVGLDKLIQDVKDRRLSRPVHAERTQRGVPGRLGNGLRLDPLCRVRGRDAEKGDT